jgi:DNA-binding XRE family transcriptional regulator
MRETLIKTGEALYGPHWQRELARALGVNERTMRRWVAGETNPPTNINSELLLLLQERHASIAAVIRRLR